MRTVFSSNEVSEVTLVRDALVHQGIEATVQNEYSGGSAVPEFRAPAEVWVLDDGDYERAQQIVTDTINTLDSKSAAPPWLCGSCREENAASFDVCWNCGREKGG